MSIVPMKDTDLAVFYALQQMGTEINIAYDDDLDVHFPIAVHYEKYHYLLIFMEPDSGDWVFVRKGIRTEESQAWSFDNPLEAIEDFAQNMASSVSVNNARFYSDSVIREIMDVGYSNTTYAVTVHVADNNEYSELQITKIRNIK